MCMGTKCSPLVTGSAPTLIKAAGDRPRAPIEAPRYPALARAVVRAYAPVRAGFDTLREAWLTITGLGAPDPQGLGPHLTFSQQEALDAAIERFLTRMRGPGATRDAFSQADGGLQRAEVLAHRVGVDRAAELLGNQPPAETLTAFTRRHLLEDAFERLSDGGRMRWEGRLEEIRSAMLDGLREGDSPFAVARRLNDAFDGYEAGRLRTLVRTEMAFASEGAIRDEWSSRGIRRVEYIGDLNTDEECSSRVGEIYDIGDLDSLPPRHPNCFCSIIPVIEEGGE